MFLLNPIVAKNILIVDDTPDNLRLLAKILESQGYIVRKALNGKLALQGIHRVLPDLILLDIAMPEMNGYEVCQQLKASEITSKIPIIFISAHDQIDDKVRAFEIGGQDYITKPFQELEVLIRVKNQLLIYQQHQQLMQQNQRLELEIAQRLQAEAEVRQLSLTDELTGLYNRRGFFMLAAQQLKIAQRTQIPCSVLFADVDGLKQINDSLGHEVGDRLIVHAAQILKQTFRETDIIARLGGDEFAIFNFACNNHPDALHLRLQASINHCNQTCGCPYQLSMSVGIQFWDGAENVDLEELLKQADKLMYEDKHRKRFHGNSLSSSWEIQRH